MAEQQQGDVQAAIEALRQEISMIPRSIEPGFQGVVFAPPGHEMHQLHYEDQLPDPNRSSGTTVVYSADGFVKAVHQREVGPVSLYADEANSALVAVLNDDHGTATGWRDYRVEINLRKTPEWQHWLTHQGMMDQVAFAEAIEAGLQEIVEPPAAEMLAIAETFEAKVATNFKQGAALANGARQLTYEEEIDAKAGKGGSLVIPEVISIGVQPFVGGTKYRIDAKLKFRLRDGKLQIGYTLDRPHETERAAFLDTATVVGAELGIEAIEGRAPAPR